MASALDALAVHDVVVNATGPWADRVRTLEDGGAAPLLQVTKGIHIVVERARLDHVVRIPDVLAATERSVVRSNETGNYGLRTTD